MLTSYYILHAHTCAALFQTYMKQMYSGYFILEAKAADFQAVYNTIRETVSLFFSLTSIPATL